MMTITNGGDNANHSWIAKRKDAQMLKKALLIAGLTFGLSSLVMAGPVGACTASTLATYITPGFTCSIGGLDYSNFTYVGSSSGSAVTLPAGSVAITPTNGTVVGLGSADTGFVLNAAWAVGPGNDLESDVTYTVTCASGANCITDVAVAMGGYGFTNDGVVAVSETSALPTFSIGTTASSAGTSALQLINITPVSSLTLVKDISVNGHSTGSANVSAIYDLFSSTSTTGTTPEPASMFLLGSGLLALGTFLRRRKASKP